MGVQAQIEADLKATYERQPRMAMVDSHKGALPAFLLALRAVFFGTGLTPAH